MRATTEDALLEQNRRFYEARGEAFAARRKGPWPGFARVLGRIPDGTVLDVGCGDGRFGVALARARPELPWIGVDRSRTLLARAQQRTDLPEARSLVALDVATHPDGLPRGPFAGIVMLGVLHHVPGEARRLALLRTLAGRLAAPGLLAVTLWRFRASDRLRRLELTWDGLEVDPGDLEPGDALLSFGGSADVPRYCHFVDDAEAERIVEAVPLPLAERFRADGHEGELNEYLLWERPG